MRQPRLLLTDAGLAALHAMMANPATFMHVRQELGIDPAPDRAEQQTAAQDGPNQAMAKLLVAARAEGANSRWPL